MWYFDKKQLLIKLCLPIKPKNDFLFYFSFSCKTPINYLSSPQKMSNSKKPALFHQQIKIQLVLLQMTSNFATTKKKEKKSTYLSKKLIFLQSNFTFFALRLF